MLYDPPTGVLTLTGEASHDAYEAAIRQIEFSTTQPIGTQKRIEVILFDGEGWSPEAKAFITVGNAIGIAAAPVLDLDPNDSNSVGPDYTATFTSGGPEIPVADTDVSITDADSTTIQSARITLGIIRVPEDVLSFTGPAAPHHRGLRSRSRHSHAHRPGHPGRLPDSLAPSGLQHHEHFHC